MTVRQLREILMKYPDEAVVFEERQAEHRELNVDDVKFTKHVLDADNGIALNAGDRQPSDPDLRWLTKCPGFLVFGAWS